MDLAKMTASLGAQVVSPAELKAAQREKLLINACINPLTAILDCHNGALLHDPWAAAIMEDVCKEGIELFSAIDAERIHGNFSLIHQACVNLRDQKVLHPAINDCCEELFVFLMCIWWHWWCPPCIIAMFCR